MEDIEIKIDGSRGLIIDRAPEDYELGASKLSSTRQKLCADGQWVDYSPAHFELQRNSLFDSFGCVSYSHQNAIEIMHKRIYGYDVDWDDRDLVVGSGTVPNQGNGVKAVADWARKNGLIKDRGDIPSEMTQDEYYSWKRGEAEKMEAKSFLEQYELGYEWLPTCNFGQSYSSPEQLMDALQYSPVQASVDGNYQYNEDGTIGRLLSWSHEIVIVGYVKDKYWLIYDSEYNKGVLKFEWDYKFGYPISHHLKKKNMQVYRKIGQSAIGFVNESKTGLWLWQDGSDDNGEVIGGSAFKSFGFTYDIAEKVSEWPLPIVGYVTVKPFNS